MLHLVPIIFKGPLVSCKFSLSNDIFLENLKLGEGC